MAEVLLYKRDGCVYCDRAISLLNACGVDSDAINFVHITTGDTDLLQEMLKKSNGQKTFPQIFINDKHIGGYSDLALLDEKGELNSLLKE